MNAPRTLETHWNSLASAALLGTHRRSDRTSAADVPPGTVATLFESLPPGSVPDEPTNVLVQVAVLSAARRAGLRAGPVASLLLSAPPDPRSMCPPDAVRRLGEIVEAWPELVEEWLALIADRNHRLPPDVIVGLLTKFRGNPAVRGAIVAIGGELVDWLLGFFPHLLPAAKPTSKRETRWAGDHAALGVDLGAPPPYPREIVELVEEVERGAITAFVDALVLRLENGALANRNRAQLVALIRQLPAAFLEPTAAALHRAGTNPHTMGLALSLGDLAALRLNMRRDLASDANSPSTTVATGPPQ